MFYGEPSNIRYKPETALAVPFQRLFRCPVSGTRLFSENYISQNVLPLNFRYVREPALMAPFPRTIRARYALIPENYISLNARRFPLTFGTQGK